MKNKIFESALEAIPNYIKIFSSKSLDIVDQVHEILDRKGMTQKDLAELLDKRESEVSRWLAGGHNITLKTISKLEDVLNEEIIVTRIRIESTLDLNTIKVNLNNARFRKNCEISTETRTHSKMKLIPLSNG